MDALVITRGDTFTRSVTIYDKTGEPFDLTGATVWFTIKPAIVLAADPTDPTDAAALVKSYWVSGGLSDGIAVAAPTTGVAMVTVPAIITMTFNAQVPYVWDLQVADANGAITTIGPGHLVVTSDVTRRATTP